VTLWKSDCQASVAIGKPSAIANIAAAAHAAGRRQRPSPTRAGRKPFPVIVANASASRVERR
jgi:hypothetical protein